MPVPCQYPKETAGLQRAFVVRGDAGLHSPLSRPYWNDNGGLHNPLIRSYLKDDDGVERWHLGWQILRFPTGYDRPKSSFEN